MRRLVPALALSVLFHAGLFFFLPPEAKPETPVPRSVLRVSLRSLPAKAEAVAPAPAAPPSPKPEPVPQPAARERPALKPPPTPAVQQKPAPKLNPAPKPKPAEPKPEQPKQSAEAPQLERSDGTPTPSEGGATAAAAQAVGAGPVATPGATAGVVDAAALRVIRKQTPEYPMISRKRRDQGTVVLLIRIESGRVTKVEVERSSGHRPLDESAMRAVREWHFDTTGYGDAITARIPFSFTLK